MTKKEFAQNFQLSATFFCDVGSSATLATTTSMPTGGFLNVTSYADRRPKALIMVFGCLLCAAKEFFLKKRISVLIQL